MSHSYKNSFKVAEKEMVSLAVTNIGFQKCNPLYQWGPGVRDHYILHHIVSGKGTFLAGSKLYTLRQGDTFLIYPDEQITYYADSEEPWEYYWVGFSGSDVPFLLQSTDITKETPVLTHSSYTEEIKNLVLQIYESRGNDIVNAVEMTGKLYLMLAIFMKESDRTVRKKDSYSSYAEKGIEYITHRYSYGITVDSIAAYVGISRSHLYRAFEKYTGMSPKAYLSDFRIRQACRLLKQSDLSIMAIANSVGFDNNLYFSKAFKKKVGMTPSDYGKNQRKSN